MRQQFVRRKRDSLCWVSSEQGYKKAKVENVSYCPCTLFDYEWYSACPIVLIIVIANSLFLLSDYCFVRTPEMTCVLDELCFEYDPKQEPVYCSGEWSVNFPRTLTLYFTILSFCVVLYRQETRGYRRISGDQCSTTTGVNYDPIKRKCSTRTTSPISGDTTSRSGFGAGTSLHLPFPLSTESFSFLPLDSSPSRESPPSPPPFHVQVF